MAKTWPGPGSTTQPSLGVAAPNRVAVSQPVDREAPTPRLTGGAVWADHARLLVTRLAHDRLPSADRLRDRARALALTFDRWEPSAPNHEVPSQEVRRARLEELFVLSEEVGTYLNE
jgi:hypothetical protein